jgi:hypothetical protein
METPTDEPNYFGQLLAVLNDEDLLRVRRRLERKHNHRLAEILTDELEEREGIQRQLEKKQ